MTGTAVAYASLSTNDVRRMAGGPVLAGPLADLERGFIEFIRRTVELAQIAAPTFGEAARATWVAERMREIGLSDVAVDGEHNALGLLPGAEPGLLLAAHTDTVFAAGDDYRVRAHGGRLEGRGIGDNSIGVTAMLEVAAALRRHVGTRRAVWFAATTGEEGLGDLRGARAVTDRLAGRIDAFVAVEGHFLGHVCTTSVGSRRWRIDLTGPGGHSWHAYGTPSAVHGSGELIHALARLRLPRRPRTTLNVGRVIGGEGVNVIARGAWLELDLRSERQEELDRISALVEGLARQVATTCGLDVTLTAIGDRPAGRIARSHPLVRAAVAALRAVGVAPAFEAASTDANYPASRGIPSICVGVTRGAGMHTTEEWVEEAPARQGLRQLLVLTAALAGVTP